MGKEEDGGSIDMWETWKQAKREWKQNKWEWKARVAILTITFFFASSRVAWMVLIVVASATVSDTPTEYDVFTIQ